MYFPSADQNYIVRKKINDPETKHLEFIALPMLAPATPVLGPPLSGRKIYEQFIYLSIYLSPVEDNTQ